MAKAWLSLHYVICINFANCRRYGGILSAYLLSLKKISHLCISRLIFVLSYLLTQKMDRARFACNYYTFKMESVQPTPWECYNDWASLDKVLSSTQLRYYTSVQKYDIGKCHEHELCHELYFFIQIAIWLIDRSVCISRRWRYMGHCIHNHFIYRFFCAHKKLTNCIYLQWDSYDLCVHNQRFH